MGEKLYQACRTGNEDLAKKLISRGADVSWSNDQGYTPSGFFRILILIEVTVEFGGPHMVGM